MEDSRRDLQNDHLNSLVPDVQVDRRGFVAACIAAGFAVTAEPLLAQAIKTSMDGLDGGDVKIGEIPAYYAVPKGKGKRPVILVIPEIWGLHEYQKDICRRLAKAGYFGVSLDPTFRIGDLKTVTEIKQSVAMANQLTDQQAFADLDAVVAWAEKHPRANAGKLGITGMCRGGRMVWMYTAHNKKIDAGVAWYGSLMPIPPQKCRASQSPRTRRSSPWVPKASAASRPRISSSARCRPRLPPMRSSPQSTFPRGRRADAGPSSNSRAGAAISRWLASQFSTTPPRTAGPRSGP